jgi:predicted alpha/beta hydrolase
MQKRKISIACKDGVTLSGYLFQPQEAVKGAVVISAALGVPKESYEPFARFLAEQGYAAVTYDNRGIGESRSDAIRGRDLRMIDWGAQDLEAVLSTVIAEGLTKRIFLVGHSAGGQLIGLAPLSSRLSGVVFAPALNANWRMYPWPFCIVIYLLMHVIIPVLSVGRDMFPARAIGFSSVDVPTGIISQWARWARQKDYLFTKKFGIDTSRYAEFTFPIMAYSFDDDTYGPQAAIEHLLSQYPKAKIGRRRIMASELGTGKIGHLGFFKEKMRQTLWKQTVEWLDALP